MDSQKNITEKKRMDHCKISVVGNVDSGKSTLVGVLTKGGADDGDGAARKKVFNYPHEEKSGRTSSIAHEIIGYKENGEQYLPDHFVQNKNKYWSKVVENSSKIVTLMDLCGHEKYLKTTMFGLTGLLPDYAMIMIGLNMGISRMTKEHLGLVFYLKIPFFVVLTKIDICPDNIYKETIINLKTLLKKVKKDMLAIEIKDTVTDEHLQKYALEIQNYQICPIFIVSSVTLQGVKYLIKFFSYLNNRDLHNPSLKSPDSPFEFDIHEHFLVSGVGIVVSGIIKSGTAKLNQIVQLGPDKNKQFTQVQIKSIHLNRTNADSAVVGQHATFNIKAFKASEKIQRSEFRKGMILLDSGSPPLCIYEFEAEVTILHNPTHIVANYQAVMHSGVIRQAAYVKMIHNKELLRNGDRGLVRFRFMYSPEYLVECQTVLFREGRTKIIGVVTRVFTENEVNQEKQLLQEQEIQKQETLKQQLINDKNNFNNQKQFQQEEKKVGDQNENKLKTKEQKSTQNKLQTIQNSNEKQTVVQNKEVEQPKTIQQSNIAKNQ